MVTDLCSIGTLFAFVLVCAGVLVLQNKPDVPRGKFKTPYINSKYIFSLLLLFGVILSFTVNKRQQWISLQMRSKSTHHQHW
jgi:amino acid transporter